MSRISKETGRPFWAFCESMEFVTINLNTFYENYYGRPFEVDKDNSCPIKPTDIHTSKAINAIGNSNYYPAATIAFLRFEAFSALAFGAQGIIYWNYKLTCPNNSIPKEMHISALTYEDCLEKTEAWYAAQTVNSEVRQFSSVFLGCTVKNVFTIGLTNVGSSSFPIGPFSRVTYTGRGITVSDITKGSRNYFVIVSADPLNSQKINIFLSSDSNKYTILYMTTLPPTFDPNNPSAGLQNIELSAGGYVIFGWSRLGN